MTVGENIRGSAAVQQSIDTIVAEIERETAAIEGPRPADPTRIAEYEALVEAAGQSRGRALLYPYLGSGAGRGALVELADGSVKWDLVTGIGVHVLGHSHPKVIRAQLESSLEDTTKHGNLQSGTAPYAFADRLVELASRGSNLRHAFLTTSGAMANESALKVCMQKRAPADRVLAFSHCFMGRSLTMTSIGDSAAARDGLPINQAVDYVPFWNGHEAKAEGGATKWIDRALALTQEHIARYPKRHAVFVMELVQGEGGFNLPHRTYLEELMKLCKSEGIPVWDDEIQTFGRTTQMFAYEAFDLGEYIDVLCVGKMSHACAAMFTEDLNPRPGLLSGTFTGATVDFAIGQVVLDELAEGGYYGDGGKFAQHHAAFREHAEALMNRHPDWFPRVEPYGADKVSGIGGMMRLTPFGGVKEKIVAASKAIYEEGAVLFWCGHGPYHLRLLPPVPALQQSDWPRIFEVLEKGMAQVA